VIAADRIGERLRRLIKELPAEQSEVLRRAYFEEQTLLVISQETSVPLGTVKSRVRLAFQHLRRALEDPP
jgi:RNA polymerase sigma-70 factor (ECF subfamily)